jgi:manganese efflux pump family protein
MNIYLILTLAFALAIDAFAVALGAGSFYGRTSRRQKFRLSFHFGLFQFLMPLLGWLAGKSIVEFVSNFDHWIACIILTIIGVNMIRESFNDNNEGIIKDITKGMSLISLSVATSIDALAIGFSIGVIGGEILFPSIIIGIVAAGMTLIGIKFGEKLSAKFGKRVSILGGIALILIGAQIVLNHLGII